MPVKSKGKPVPANAPVSITIPPIHVGILSVEIEGITPLICHKFSSKIRGQLLDQAQNKKVKTREAKNPEQEFNDARYRIDENGIESVDGTGADAIPARYLKEAMVHASRFIQGLTMVETKALIFVEPGVDGVPITNGGKGIYGIDLEPEMEQSIQRVGGKGPGTGKPDVRFRPLYRKWGAKFQVHYNSALVGPEEVLNLINYAGFHAGLCEHRPSKSGGQNGMFRVKGGTK